MNTLYRFYDHTGQLLYVGLTVNPGRRMERHRGREWWKDVARIEMEQHPDHDSLRDAERSAIQAERPLHNIRMNRRVLLNAEELAILAEGCAEWVDDKDNFCGSPATHLALRDHYGGGIFVCAEHAAYYAPVEVV